MRKSLLVRQMRACRRITARAVPAMALGIVMMASLTLFAGVVKADVLYNNLSITDNSTYTTSAQNYISTDEGSGRMWDVQAADDFTLSNPYAITSVTADLLSPNGAAPANGVLVEFFSDIGGSPAAISSFATVTQSYSVANFDNHLDGNIGMRFTVDLSAAGITLETGTWWVSVVPVDESGSGDGYFWVRQTGQPLIGSSAHNRNGGEAHGNGFGGPFGNFEWREFGTFGPPSLPQFQAGDLAMAVEGTLIPGPGVLAVFTIFGVIGSRRRRWSFL